MKNGINATKFNSLVFLLFFQLILGINNKSFAQQDIDLTSAEKGVEMVGEFTGALNFNVPIATVTAGSLSAPVNIAYVSNGLLPHSVSSSIGLGWNLNDIAVIYKNSRGMDDTWREYDGNMFCPGEPVCDIPEYYDTALDDADIDGAYDIYTYNIMGYAGKFIVYPSSNSCIQISKSDVVIERIDMWNFKVILPNGNIIELYRKDYPNINDGFKNQAQTWQPKNIYSYDLKDTLKFKYDYTTYGFNTLVDDIGISIAPNLPTYKQQNKYFPTQRLSKIIGKLDSVTFYYENRLDISSPTGLKCNKIRYESDNVCIENNLIADYFTDGPNGTGNATQVRLKEISRNKCGSTVDTLPRYKFEYYYYLNGDKFAPPKYTTGIDEWGYYNGATSNVQSNMRPNYLPDGIANRNVYTNNTMEATLKKITYPTGQTSLIEYEQNRFFKSIDAIQSIFNLYTSTTVVSPSVTIIADQIANGSVSMNLVPAGSTSYTSFLSLKIKNMQNVVLHTISFSNTNGAQVEDYTIALKDIKDYANNQVLVVGTSYYFELTINNGSGNAIATYYPTNVEHLCGGLRVSKITNSNGNTALDDVTNYIYENGVQYQSPSFTDYFASNWIYFNRLLKDENVMMDYNIGYGKVTISKPGNGKIVKLFKSDFSKEYGENEQRIVTDKLKQGVGSLLSSSVYDNNNVLLSKDSFMYEVVNLGIAGHNKEYFTEIGSGNYLGYAYQYNKFWFRLKKVINYYLGVETNSTETFYNHSHTVQPSSTRVTTGNNEINEVYTDYTNNTWVDVNVKNYFNQKNIIIPYTTTVFRNSIQVSSSTTHHSFFSANGLFLGGGGSNTPGSIVRETQTFKGDYNLSGVQTNSADPAEFYNHEYTIDGQIKVNQKSNWAQELFTYNNERLATTTRTNFVKSITYYGNSELVHKEFNVDGTYTEYTYDGMLRKKTKLEMPANILTEYFYNYYTPSVNYNSVRSKTTYPIVAGSALNIVENIEFTDKFGRVIAQLSIKGSPSQKDVLTAYEYDNKGRLIKEFLPVETIYNNGTFIPVGSGNISPGQVWKYKETKYEASPLSRVVETIPADWYATKFEYGLNVTNDNVNQQISGTYAIGKLYKFTTIDENGNRSIKYKDFSGKLICERLSDSGDLSTKRRDTYTHYDNKNRIIKVLPPDASIYTPELIYEYTYDDENKLTSKKVPGKGVVNFYYNNRDLVAAEQDANQAALNPKEWIVSSYDVYGRLLKYGLFKGNTLTDLQNPTFTTVYFENIYGTAGIEIDKVKTQKTNILGTINTLNKTYVYDSRGRVQNVTANNIHNNAASDVTVFSYDNGNNLLSEARPVTVTIGSTSTYTITNSFTYDHRGRTIDENFKYNTGTITTICSNVYNWRSDLVTQKQGKFNATTYLQNIDFTYRPNGMLEKINQYLGTSTTGDLFYEEMFYDNPISGSGAAIRKNGEIANVKWQRRGSTIIGGLHAYSYNEFGELGGNNYYTITGATTFTATNAFDETFNFGSGKYGKIVNHTKNNNVGTSLDNLTYNYVASSPRTANVNDISGNILGHNQNGQATSGNIYTYDLNGNQNKDPYRGVTNITYNFLNLPTLIDFGGGKKVEMTYDAAGVMLTKKVYNTGAVLVENRTYNNGLEFVAYGTGNQTLELVHHSQGYYKPSVSRHVYTIKDHLGNTRIVYTDANNDGSIAQTSAEILDENHYYAYGMEMTDPSWYNGTEYKYKFNGIERTESLGLNIDLALYRGLDPVLGKWYQVDPKAEKAGYNMSPYCAMGNSPVCLSDPEGDIAFVPILIGMAIGAAIHTSVHLATNNFTFNNWNWGSFAGSVASGAVGGGVSSAITSAGIGGFAGGAISGGSSGFTHSLTSGLINGNFDAGSLIKSTLIGAGLGGTFQGIGSSINGRSFLDGSKLLSQNILVDQNIPNINQSIPLTSSSNNDCLPAVGAAIDQSFGGSTTTQIGRNWFSSTNPDDVISARDFFKRFSTETGHVSGGAALNNIDLLPQFMKSGERIAFLTNVNGGHAVVLDNIVERSIQKVNGLIINKTIYNVMDPAVGKIVPWNMSTVSQFIRVFK